MRINGITSEISIYTGAGKESISMFRGNFKIKDRLINKSEASADYSLSLEEKDGLIFLKGRAEGPNVNRTWIRFSAKPGEHVTGGGEQFSYVDMRGREYPIWTREQGVGRNKHTLITRLADAAEGAGGDYHTTFYPQPTFISSEMYFAHLLNYEYSCLDFTNEAYHEICVWSAEFTLVLGSGACYRELLGKLTGFLGRQRALPDWAIRGIWLGVQGGTERACSLLKACRDGGADIPVVWIQDWEGKRVTSFGKRLQWDWRWNREMYPELDTIIAGDPETRWMGYINPYLVEGGVLFEEARRLGYFVKTGTGSDYLFDFGEFNCGVVDLTLPAAFEWYKGVIKTNLIGFGFKGWMADFGEYLPVDAVCHGGSGAVCHNMWPMLWAKCNREAVREAGVEGDCVFFTRSGAAGTQAYSTLMWGGDQNVDFSEDDGLPSVITAALSLGMSGFGLHTCDCGGYTTLFHLKRSEELMLRWLEYSCFTPVMRTHEGNRPDSNVQLYSNETMISAAARWSRIHNMLSPYLRECMRINEESGIPVQRPLFLDEPGEDKYYDRSLFEYMLGDDLLVAPVVKKGRTGRTVEFPEGEWISLWSGKSYSKGAHRVSAPIGRPPVFYRRGSAFTSLFEEISNN